MMLKRILPLSLFGRSLLIIITPLVIVQVVATFVFFDRHWETVTRRLANSLAGDLALLIDLRERPDDIPSDPEIYESASRYLDMQITFQPGAILPNAEPNPSPSLLETQLTNALSERVRRPFQVDVTSLPRDIGVRVQLPDGVFDVTTGRKRLTSSTGYLVIMWMVGTSLVTLAVATAFMRRQIRPIFRLAHAADSFGRGIDVPDFKPEGATEVRQAARAFLLMRERIRRQISQRTEMLAGVSHDLRTPITRMKLQLAMMPAGVEAEGLKTDLDDMERMVDGYLAFVRGEGSEAPVPTSLPDLLEDVVSGARRQGREVNLAVPELDPPGLTVSLRPDAIKRCIGNLVANACRHGRRVQVALKRLDRSVEITVDDDGPGIPLAEREAVFRPFFRLDPSRNPATGGTGLGLTIARDVARGHGGDVELADSPIGGLRATVRLPV
ncbi:MAG: HAMP domain-containing protein [Proteobacteria bacterium]|nr:HAMP domain-containing protein [Pseudomonadota bacterium]